MSNKIITSKQKYLQKVKSSFVYKINKLFALYKSQSTKFFNIDGLGYSEITTINIMGQLGGETTLSEITSVHWIDPGLVSRISKSLEKKNLIKKIKTQKDKRSNILVLTSKGKSIFVKIEKFISLRRKKILKHFSAQEAKKLISLLDKLVSSTQKEYR
ncbi:MAG: MarR family winged helix-turn-helix transcriptional regulator [Proteobacteria bacterium]|nr:MarR family winged helix-turn-helix transcriptional regulator [Pseudomonadota bacterium]MDA0971753.1 MarR family winged helix-turn-helix transcriptional regulator [Pseudomonadota bacterium]